MAVGNLDDLAAHSFDLVNRELASTLDNARRELEDYVDGNADRNALLRTADLLHLARGALKIVEIHGAALLAEEMEQTCRRLAEPGEHAKDEQGLEALTRAMVQLPAYLERLLGGGKDVALVLLPLLNDLRQARDKPSLSEGTLVLLNAGPLERHLEAPAGASAADAGRGFEKVAQRLRPAFQSALLGWIKGNDVGKHLDELLRVSLGLERAAATDQVKQLWTVIVAVLTAIRAGGIEATVTLKRLLGQADRQLKRLIDGGEAAIVNAPPVDLINSLLYYVARSTTDDTRITKLRDIYGLSDMLPAEDQLEAARTGLAGPSIKLMRTVAHAIKEDLGAVKDVLDIFVRTGMQDIEKLGPQLELLKKIGDTLGVLGLERARSQIQRETQELGAIVASHKTVDRAALEKVAATLLEVEDALDRELVSAVMPDGESPAGEAAPDTQQRHVTQAVMGECIVNLAKIKESVIQLVDQPGDARALDQVKPQLRGIVAGLLMLDKTKALQVVERIGAVIATRLAPSGATFRPEHLERLADSIVSVEYYMETVSAGRSDPWYMLENAERCLSLLEKLPVVKTAPRHAPAPTPAPEVAPEPPKPAPPKPAAKRPSVMEVEQDRSDPELVELFIEEAKEEVANIARQLPTWTADSHNSEALISVRRSFHTLKGSGRMVGAQLIGEYAWSIENLLNRLINQTLSPTPAMVEFIAAAAKALPELIEQLEIGLAPKTDVHLLMKQAEAFAEGDAAAGTLTSRSLRMPAPPPQPAAEGAPPSMDPVLADIFVKEMRGHVKVVREFIERAAQRPERHPVDEPLYRACHTLLGSARMAGFQPAIALAGPLAEHLRKHFDAGTGLTNEGIEALRAAAVEIDQMADALVAGRDYSLSAAMPSTLAALAKAAATQPAAAPRAVAPNEAAAPPKSVSPPPAATAPATTVPEPPPAVRTEAPPAAATAEPGAAVDDVYDAEIAAIFAEEAAEILDNAELALRSLRQEPAPAATVELQRLLHTLKGGARMAGISAMGTLSHALETLIERIAGGHVEPAAATLDVVQRSLDQLQQMRDSVAAGRAVAPSVALVGEIERAATSTPAPAAAPAPASELQPAELELAPEPVAPAPEASAPPPPSVAPPSTPSVAPEPAAPVPTIEDSGAIELSAANLDELESIELPSSLADDADVPTPAAADDPTAEEEILEEPTVIEKMDVASLEIERVREVESAQPPDADSAPPPEADSAPPPAAQPATPDRRTAERAETARVDASLLDVLLNGAGEINIFQSRLTQQLQSIEFHLGELGSTVSRLRDQLRKLEAETEAQILHRHQDDVAGDTGFDPLELDRYSTIQQLSRALAESANDVASINELLGGLRDETETLLTQQARVTAELQNGLMQTRMVPFQRHVARLARIVRQAAADTGKAAELFVEGENNEIDRQVLESMLPPFEHLLRNAVAHGIEAPAARKQRGKPELGRVTLKVKREGSEVLIDVADDGGGLDLAAIRRKALEKGLVADGQKITDDQAIELILQPGFSTAGELTQTAGRGVGMDVVDNEVKKLGGSMRIESTPGQGTRFLIRLPYTLAITHALIVNVGEETFALPLPTVEGITRLSREKILKHLTDDEPKLDYGGITYRIQHLGSLVGGAPSALPDEENSVSLVLIRAGESSTALLTDSLEGSREIVVKTLGPHIANVAGVTGATILGDGRVIMILDPGTLVRAHRSPEPVAPVAPQPVEHQLTALVVDDSITMRRVTQRLLERRGAKVLTARDGLDAITVLQEHEVDIILLDIEMPRMDGYQFATHVRNDPRLKDVPIIMITSRSGEKHRAKAIEIGVNDYLSKPYQESQLMAAIEALLGKPL